MNCKSPSKYARLFAVVISAFISLSCASVVSLFEITPPPPNASPTRVESQAENTPPAPPTAAPVGTSRGAPYPHDGVISVPNWQLQILEVKRGAAAWQEIQAANQFNQPADEGMEYLLIKIRAKTLYADNDSHTLDRCNFNVTGNRFIEYSCNMAIIVAPEPRLDVSLFSGGEAEGWAAYAVAQGEGSLTLVFNETFDEANRRYIALDEGATLNVPADLANLQADENGTERARPAARDEQVTAEDWQLSIREVMRGEDAWAALQEANQFNDPPPEGMEYILVKVRVRYIGLEDRARALSAAFFKTSGDKNVLYKAPNVVAPQPRLDVSLYPGGEFEGWAVGQVAIGEKDVLLVFDPLFDLDGKNRRFIALE